MDMSKFYMNDSTGEITNDHAEAVQWYSNGNEVSIYVNRKVKLTWFH